ncbi:HsmA family protein [Acetobacterium woodii]|uniref:Putative membrane protein n=1 Tax=Acetobacterium woodii (strain ATCC 29683 / DSM 1030 / JCM 2381 / KCTC 1655 / WB1) TaxID=931626 RepID=H6LGJ9_ACEWD|nr:HsmA family protein [Acetobacterium woodii]AFA48327.1 putative membrane protein [Acetobacterium woodii DSM 1030]
MLIYAIVFISTACLLYTIGVWSEKIQKKLKVWHVCVFWGGFLFDTLGTSIMGTLAGGMFQFNFHGITGIAAIILMLFHAIWATIVVVRDDEKMKREFSKFSIFVWFIWLIPMVSGMIYGVGM